MKEKKCLTHNDHLVENMIVMMMMMIMMFKQSKETSITMTVFCCVLTCLLNNLREFQKVKLIPEYSFTSILGNKLN